MKKFYLAGPMQGYIRYNFDTFFEVEEKIKNRYGLEVINPARMDLDIGFNPDLPLDKQTIKFSVSDRLREDFKYVLDSIGIILLPNWEFSFGAKMEFLIAKHSGLKCYEVSPAHWNYNRMVVLEETGAQANVIVNNHSRI